MRTLYLKVTTQVSQISEEGLKLYCGFEKCSQLTYLPPDLSLHKSVAHILPIEEKNPKGKKGRSLTDRKWDKD